MESGNVQFEYILRRLAELEVDTKKAKQKRVKVEQENAELRREVQRLTQQQVESSARGSQSDILNPDSQSII